MLPSDYSTPSKDARHSSALPEASMSRSDDDYRQDLEVLVDKIVNVCTYESEILINRHPDEVWRIATRETGSWWRDDLREDSLGVIIEPHVGGRIWQRFDESGSGILYGTVVAVEPPNMIHFTSTISIFGVALCAYTCLFSECGEGTLVNISVQVLSEYPERFMCGIVKRRIGSLMNSLKQYADACAAG